MIITSPFELIKILFENRKVWNTISKSEKSKHWFIVNRTLSIGYPKQAQYLNINGINTTYSIDVWFHFLNKQGLNRCPGWVYTKSQVLKDEKTWWPSSETIRFYCTKNKCSEKDLIEWQKYLPQDFETELKPLDKILKKEKTT